MSEDASKISRDTPGLKSFAAVVFAGLDARTPAPEGVVQTDPPVVPAPEGVFVSETCEGEVCWCGKPAVRKVGEEFAYDEPNPNRHNLTRYICAHHFAELMGPAGARSVGIAPVVPVGSGEAGVYTQADYEEAAALGERDGYEKAVQDIDLLTGGDGEYKATTHDGVIDMPVMKARIIQRFSSLRQLVVPVGVSREEIARALFERHWSAVSASPKWPGDDDGSYWLWLADAILAALRPADTGANHD